MAHLDDVSLSAHLDGDADHGAHLQACAQCRARLAQLEAVTRALASPPAPLSPAARDRLVIAATKAAPLPGPTGGRAATGNGAGAVRLVHRRHRRGRWVAVAAVVLAGLAAIPLLSADRSTSGDAAGTAALRQVPERSGGMTDDDAGASGAAESLAAPAPAAGGGPAAEGPVDGGDLGPHREVAEVARVVRARLDGEAGGWEPGPPVEARCEQQARADGAPGPLAYVATLTWRGAPAEALAFRVAGEPRGYLLAVMARPGCATLARARI